MQKKNLLYWRTDEQDVHCLVFGSRATLAACLTKYGAVETKYGRSALFTQHLKPCTALHSFTMQRANETKALGGSQKGMELVGIVFSVIEKVFVNRLLKWLFGA